MKARNKIIKARNPIRAFQEMKIKLNSEMDSKTVDEMIGLSNEAEFFEKYFRKIFFVSARGYYRVLKVARTIADLEESEGVGSGHLAEAFQYRIREKGDKIILPLGYSINLTVYNLEVSLIIRHRCHWLSGRRKFA